MVSTGIVILGLLGTIMTYGKTAPLRYTFFVQTFKCRQPDFLAIFKFRRISADSVFSIFKCRRVSADKGWLFISSDAKVQTLALSQSCNLVILVQKTMPLLLPLTPILTYITQ